MVSLGPDRIRGLESLLQAGRETALLRFSLGSEELKRAGWSAAAVHLRRATVLDPRFSAAWKLLGQALEQAGEWVDAQGAWRQGVTVATARGDEQAAREMRVFLNRLNRKLPDGD